MARYALLAGQEGPFTGEHPERRAGAPRLELPPGLQGEVNDPWDYWVFGLGGDVRYDDEDLKDEKRYSANFSANRTTEMWKISVTGRGSYTDTQGQYSDGTQLRGYPEGRVHRWSGVLFSGGAVVGWGSRVELPPPPGTTRTWEPRWERGWSTPSSPTGIGPGAA